jgi:uncharacterized membrane protein
MKRRINPTRIFITLVIFSTWSSIYLGYALKFNENELIGWKIFSLAFMIVCMISLIVLFIIHIRNKKIIDDEFTTRIVFKAGFYSFITISMLITLAFISLAILMLINKNSSTLAEFLNYRIFIIYDFIFCFL